MHRPAKCVLLFVGLITTGCSSNLDLAPTDTTTRNTTNETFAGTLTLNGAATYPFASGASTVSATLSALAPDSTVVVGLSLGTWNGTACQVVLANDKATQGTVVVGNASTSGNLCVRIYDVGSLVQSQSYQIDVVHF